MGILRKARQILAPQQRRGGKSASLGSPTKKPIDRSKETVSPGGGFRSMLSRQHETRRFVFNDEEECTSMDDSSSCITEHTTPTKENSWSSAGSWDHHAHSPLFVTLIPSLKEKEEKLEQIDDCQQLGLIMAKNRRLPGTCYYSSNHVLVNKERVKRNIPALTRSIELDELARHRADAMATSGEVQHGDIVDIQSQLYPCRRFGENVASGYSIRDIHKAMAQNDGDRNNMIDRRYAYMGMGTATDEDGKLYLCQIFKG